MNGPETILQAQLTSLLKLVEQRRDEQREEALRNAARQSAHILREAFAEARRRMAEAVAEERLRMRRQMTAAQAQLQSRVRQERHRAAQLMLHRGWEQLQDALNARWKNTQTREQWISVLVQQALTRLPSKPWTIEHPLAWDPAEFADLAQSIESHTGAPPRFLSRDEIIAGLRICADGACLDGTQQGLLYDRSAVEAHLMAHINRLTAEQSITEPEEETPEQ